jgi:predicted RNase H-like nuclease (RuvC/YqgF family)
MNTELQRKDTELYTTASELAQKSEEVERLRNEKMHLSHAMDEMQSTLGWQFLEKMRDIRDRMLPRETARGKIYQSVINRLKGRGRKG